MAKLKNTTSNKLLIMGASTVIFGIIGKISGKGSGNGTIYMIAGAVLGFFISPLIMDFTLEPKSGNLK